ncbi:DNA-3-methyladenine glycosylase I [Marinobacter antarcticus]|uniref:DNA-3-methyladenine glycosylase I n=1 Tax=Marinobacter antarcticus TaxID=564117 RepID=A0A1M6PL07_9GAMM|nr:DNA-3-methyladenine glycosylase I [Marinobacter antarcticus]SHK08639.1 DNA-3-methyladenine glycosylase I [Marinobacter antarcticus]
MRFSDIHERAIARKGGVEELNALMPKIPSATELEARTDDRYLSEITRCIFKAGFVWRVIDNKWSGFEAAFHNFVPVYWQQVSPDVLEELVRDERIVRNLQKIRTVPENARMIMDVVYEHGSFGAFLRQWPSMDQAGLLLWLKRHGSRLGGNSAQYFLRRVGWDGFIMSSDVMQVLRQAQLVDASTGSKKALYQVQEAFNAWHDETGLPFSQLSRIVSCSVDS